VFSVDQNRLLRVAMAKLAETMPSQKALGDALGLAQQNAGRLMRDRRAGFSYATATALVRLLGFGGVDEFFAKRQPSTPPGKNAA
jgi:hypothetical protein